MQEEACWALWSLAYNADNKALIKKEGGEEVVRTAMAAANATDRTKDQGQRLLDKLAQR